MSFFTPKHFEDASRVLRGLALVAARAAADRRAGTCCSKQLLRHHHSCNIRAQLCEGLALCELLLSAVQPAPRLVLTSMLDTSCSLVGVCAAPQLRAPQRWQGRPRQGAAGRRRSCQPTGRPGKHHQPAPPLTRACPARQRAVRPGHGPALWSPRVMFRTVAWASCKQAPSSAQRCADEPQRSAPHERACFHVYPRWHVGRRHGQLPVVLRARWTPAGRPGAAGDGARARRERGRAGRGGAGAGPGGRAGRRCARRRGPARCGAPWSHRSARQRTVCGVAFEKLLDLV